jgi:hypothetical protein
MIFTKKKARVDYFQKCDQAITKWRSKGPQPLNNGGWDIHGQPLQFPNANGYNSGIYLFTDRNNISHFFKPNFLPPYDTKEKRTIILDYLKEEWDEKTLLFRPVKSVVDIALDRLRMRHEERSKNMEVEEKEGKGGDMDDGDEVEDLNGNN